MPKFTFFYKLTESDEKHTVTTKDCVKPKRTKVWKQLQVALNCGEFHTIGFEIVSVYIIVDWTNKRLFPTKTFDSFEEGWEFIYENIEEEEEDDGTYEDVFVVQVSQ